MMQEVAAGNPSSKRLSRPLTLVAIAATLATGGVMAYSVSQGRIQQSSTTPSTVISTPQIKTVTALGRLEPEGEAIALSAPTSAEGNRVDQLLVKEGDRVRKGQAIAILNSRDRLQASVMQAQEQVRVAQAKLDQVRAGAKTGEIQAQRSQIAQLEAERVGDLNTQAATVARLEAEVQNAQVEYQRYASLYQNGAVSASQRDSKRLAFTTAQKQLQEAQAARDRTQNSRQQQLNEARATLDRIAEVRPVDVQVAQADVRQALAAVEQAKANLEQASVRSPQDGQILKIYTRPGELISNDGIAEIGRTQQMFAIAEVYQSDIKNIRPGQTAQVSSDSIDSELIGTVEQVGYKVLRQDIVNSDPSANIDGRIVEVKIRLDADSSGKAARLTNQQVKVVIKL
ncbi:ABC exporter membrane fusion protein [Funiculus sociatus GB2-A5]|uniref:ABC exporter membrane fusion protein n=1 Tax=Funiculus sociatus GB2-A5 TaxID=2933946 RepID=A0ABV0JI58_9CYAN|nr:ABC exporter membrane fusion protein [Microcoleus sp. FACHB-831]MBD1922567.1 ABC exporter membrane fusion protein [Microcoleus sp. FACHB-831]MBD2065654.1 ABC exporter membrane fusion protein [Trichocoleus sp. FACHB-6]